MIAHSVSTVAVAMRSGCPARHPSPKKAPGPRSAMTACWPCLDRTVNLTFPRSTKNTASAGSPWEKTTSLLRCSFVVLPSGSAASRVRASKAALPLAFILRLLRYTPYSRLSDDGPASVESDRPAPGRPLPDGPRRRLRRHRHQPAVCVPGMLQCRVWSRPDGGGRLRGAVARRLVAHPDRGREVHRVRHAPGQSRRGRHHGAARPAAPAAALGPSH